MPGTHAQNVRCTALEEQFAPASTLADGLALALPVAFDEGLAEGVLLPQAVSRAIAAPAAIPVVIFFDNMSGGTPSEVYF
jgi:hypothetical protein